ncbi:hypothetical protein N7G274_001785 [Stereocaulon virgatum]|uniref:D-mandelate dehydrogenase n=1 Tax=Stereocaulon virgatum TaxID=373712 RepID=A0ABR4AMJ1_9LECA
MAVQPPKISLRTHFLTMSPVTRPKILHLGDEIEYHKDIHTRLLSQFVIIRPNPTNPTRSEFIRHLKDKTWGDFSAIMRPYWNTGNEMRPWDRELIELLPKSMKVMASAGAGYDWVDVEALAQKGILYCNGAGASTESVADMALWYIISVFRNMTWSSLAARSDSKLQWEKAHKQIAYRSDNPRGHTLGIIGLGNIGFAIAKKAKAAFDMDILYYDTVRKSKEQEDEVGAEFYDNLDEMLRHSDCILLATPAGETIITARTLALLPQDARVINIARGCLVDEEALADALDTGHISAAGLDVHAKEPGVINPRLRDRHNVTLTSHTGGSSLETVEEFERLAMENVERVLNGEPALTAVNTIMTPQNTTGRASGLINGATAKVEHRNGH